MGEEVEKEKSIETSPKSEEQYIQTNTKSVMCQMCGKQPSKYRCPGCDVRKLIHIQYLIGRVCH